MRDFSAERVAQLLREDTADMKRSAGELRATVHELHPEPTAPVELTEAQILALLPGRIPEDSEERAERMADLKAAEDRLRHVLRIERGPCGAFDKGGSAA